MTSFDEFDVQLDTNLNDEEIIGSSTSRKKEVNKRARTNDFGDAKNGTEGRSVNADGTVYKAAVYKRNPDGSAEGYEGASHVPTTTGDRLKNGIQVIVDNPAHKHHKKFEAVEGNDINKGWVAINTDNDAWEVMQEISKHTRLRKYVKDQDSAVKSEFLETKATTIYSTNNKKFKGEEGNPARITFLPTTQRTARLRVLDKRKRSK